MALKTPNNKTKKVPATSKKKRVPAISKVKKEKASTPKQRKVDGHGTTKETPKTKPISKQGKTRTSTKTSKPVTAPKRPSEQSRPRQSDSRENWETSKKQIVGDAMRKLSYSMKLNLWKEINEKATAEEFYTIRPPQDLPKKMVMQLDEAVARGEIDKTPSNRSALYCSYCVDWMPFRVHSWSGYKRCTGCGISTKDYYIRSDNNLWKE